MIDLLCQVGLSNACFSLLLAVIALVVGAVTRRPHLAYLLWLLVFIKLMTPPAVSIPLADVSWLPVIDRAAQGQPVSGQDADRALPSEDQPLGLASLPAEGAAVARRPELTAAGLAGAKTWVLLVVVLGSLLAFAWSVIQLLQFNRRLAAATAAGPRQMQNAAADIAHRLGLRRVPVVYVTSARLSPMVWWMQGRVAVIIPAQLLQELDSRQWQWILAHELAHVRRRDYLVRWLEWLAGVCFWWNPVVWWAQRNLRAAEEICCDALVLTSLKPKPHFYAKSLLTVVEFLTYPVFRAPAMASEINSGGFFLRRCRMIVSNKPNRTNSRWLQALVLLFALVVLPLGAHLYAKGDPEAGKGKTAMTESEAKKADAKKQSADEYLKQAWTDLQAEVEVGKLTESEAEARFEELKMALQLNAFEGACAKAEYEVANATLAAELAAGDISEQEAEAKLAEAEKAIKERQAGQREEYAALAKAWDRLETLIEEGMATFEEAVREYESAKEKILSGGSVYASAGPRYEKAVAEFQTAIRAGEMSHAEAFARLSAVEMAAYADEFAKAEQMYREEAIQAGLAAAVASGEMTQEEAEAKLQAYQQDVEAKKEYCDEEVEKQKQQETQQKVKQKEKDEDAEEKGKG